MPFSRVLTSTLCVFAVVQLTAARELFQTDCEDDTCVEEFAKCGGTFFNVSTPCCDPDHSCVTKNYFYAQCLTEERAAINVANGWDGTVLDCEEMPDDVLGGPADVPASRRLQQESDMGSYGDVDCEDDTCGALFDKCGGGFNVSTTCCDPKTSCVVKNWFYAQCLTEERAAENVATWGWDGRVLYCEEMPEDAPKGPVFWDFNKTVDDVEYEVRTRRLSQAMESDCEDDECVETFEKCGGKDFNVSVPCCDATSMCVVKNWWYAQCLSAAKAEANVELWGWDGRTLECEEMPEDLKPEKPMSKPEKPMSSRRLQQAGGYGGYGDKGGYGTEKGGYGMDKGSYGGSRSFTLPAEAPAEEPAAEPVEEPAEVPVEKPSEEPASSPEPSMAPMAAEDSATVPVVPGVEVRESPLVIGSGCDECAPIFGQCGDKGAIVSCCREGLECSKKHGFYAQCLTPERAARNVENFDWDGAVLPCGEKMV